MGNSISIPPAPAGSSYDRWKLYRSTTQTGTFSVINGTNGQATTDLSFYDLDGTSTSWYKYSYYDSSGDKESDLSAAFQGILLEVYTSVKKVERFLQLGQAISDTTKPNISDVAMLISRAEDRIDRATAHAWRLRYSGTESGIDQTPKYEYYDMNFRYEWRTGIPLYLKHRKIRAFSASAGDKLEIWDGSSYTDYIASKTEGRADDFWVDYERGIVYINSRYLTYTSGTVPVRIKYRYGDTIVNRLIEEIATKMVAIQILSMESRSIIIPEGSAQLNYGERIKLWREENEEDLARFKEFQVMSLET